MTPEVRPQIAHADRLSAMFHAIWSPSPRVASRVTSIDNGTKPKYIDNSSA